MNNSTDYSIKYQGPSGYRKDQLELEFSYNANPNILLSKPIPSELIEQRLIDLEEQNKNIGSVICSEAISNGKLFKSIEGDMISIINKSKNLEEILYDLHHRISALESKI